MNRRQNMYLNIDNSVFFLNIEHNISELIDLDIFLD